MEELINFFLKYFNNSADFFMIYLIKSRDTVVYA